MTPLRQIDHVEGWPAWTIDLLAAIKTIFDTIAYTWGWGMLLGSSENRETYKKLCESSFEQAFLLPLREAGKVCRKKFNVIDRPSWLEDLADHIPSIHFDLIPLSLGVLDERIQPIVDILRLKRGAFLYGDSYVTLDDYGTSKSPVSAEVELGKALGQATQKLGYLLDIKYFLVRLCRRPISPWLEGC